jgi:tetratricopeptide (TPR) repeat protein
MQIFWTANNLIENCTPGSKVPQLAVSSTPEEWAKSGRSLFRSKRYFQAIHCFERAGMPREMAIAEAYLLRETARALPGGSKILDVARATAFSRAAVAFIACAEAATDEKTTYYRRAGECYVQAGQNFEAGHAFLNSKDYTDSARHYRKAQHFDEAVDVVQRHEVDASFKETLIDVARLYYITSGALK